jgi:dimethylamine corrinoid protein
MLFAAGFEVYDVGKDIPSDQFVSKAKEVNANLIGASALLSTSLPMQREIVEGIVNAGLRDKVKLMFGGAPVTQEWVKEIGGDGYAENAIEAVNVAKKILKVEA